MSATVEFIGGSALLQFKPRLAEHVRGGHVVGYVLTDIADLLLMSDMIRR